MAYIYHKEDGSILAVSPTNILSFSEKSKVTFVSELSENVDYSFYKISDLGVLSENVGAMKSFKLAEIAEVFDKEMGTHTFVCNAGFRVDNRRSGTKNDKDNVTSLVKLALDGIAKQMPNGVVPNEMLDVVTLPFKGVDGIYNMTINQLKSLEIQMIEDGFAIYQKKWELEARIQAGTSNDEIQAIKW